MGAAELSLGAEVTASIVLGPSKDVPDPTFSGRQAAGTALVRVFWCHLT